MTGTQLVGVDLDGTLIGDALTISSADRAAIAAARDSGVKFCLATGRLFSAARPFAQELGLDGYLIPLNGAAVYELATATLAHVVPLDRGVALEAIEALRFAGFRVQLYFDDQLFLDGSDERSDRYVRMSRVTPVMVPDLQRLLDDSPPDLPGPMKVLGIGGESDVLAQIAALGARFGSRANVFRSQRDYLEITDPHADKGSALAWVASHLSIGMDAVAAIGDSDNDVSMFERAAQSFAMGTATPLAKASARRIVGAQGRGVADAIALLMGSVIETA
jgi:Cof subfamily protein (haloacid dehalogenase superfamily)